MKTTTGLPAGGARRRRLLHGLKNLSRRARQHHPKLWLMAGIAIVLFALVLPRVYTFYLATRWPPHEMDQRSASAFVALMFKAGDEASGERATISPDQFRRHVNALTEAGYQFIGLRDVERFMREGHPLPRHAVLIGVDYRGSTRGWDAWKMAVVRSQARAVMIFNPERSPRLAWRVIHQTAATPHWDIAAAFDASAFETLAAGHDDDGNNAPERAFQYNRLHTMNQTAVREHRTLRSAMRHPSGQPVTTLVYPHPRSDAPFDASTDLMRHLLARNASPHFKLGFVPGNMAVNTDRSDPLFLNSRMVPPDWDERMLIQYLRTCRELPFETPDAEGNPQRAAWSTVFGSPSLQSDHLHLSANPGEVTGLWLTGSDRFKTFDAEIRFSLEHGILRIPFMAAANEADRWELLLEAGGRVDLLRRQDGHAERIATDRRRSDTRDGSRLNITQRHDQLLVAMNDQPLFNGWVPLNEPATRGLMGVRLVTADNIPAVARIEAFRVLPPSTTIALLEGPPEEVAKGILWTGRHSRHVTALSPSLEHMHNVLSDTATDIPGHNMFHVAARIHGWDLLPHVNIGHPRALEPWTPERILSQLTDIPSDGILFRLDDQTNWTETRLADWGRQAAETLTAHGYRLFVRLPALAANALPVTATLGRIPNIQWVVPETESAETRRGEAVEIRIPDTDPERDLQLLFDFLDIDRDTATLDDQRQWQRRRDQAESRYARGEYEDAIALWFTWHENDPHHPAPLRRIGDALQRLGYHDEATEFYQRSLDLDPGNVELAVLVAHRIDDAGRHEEARHLLFIYDLLFPDHPSILLAQALWSHRHHRLDHSRARFQRLLELKPDHLQSVLMIARLGSDAAERRTAMQRLLDITQTPEQHRLVLEGIRDLDIMTLPESETLLPLLQRRTVTEDPVMAAILDQLKPRFVKASLTAATMATQTAWRVEGIAADPEHGRIAVRSALEREEAMLRLNGSERWHDTFVEADLVSHRGEFWLVARRSRDHMVRFGFDGSDDRLRLQIWKTGDHEPRLLKNISQTWRPPEGGARLRLEIRGSGATGTIDGAPWGPPPIQLPGKMSPGWVAVMARSSNPGDARMTLRRVAAGPLFPVIARFDEPREAETTDRLADRLHTMSPYLNTLSPSGFSIDATGRWTTETHEEDAFSKLFARFQAYRFMPRVLVDPGAQIAISDVLQASKIHHTDGFVLEFTQAPDTTTLETLERDLRETGIDVFLLVHRHDAIYLRGIGRNRGLLPGENLEHRLTIHTADTPDDRAALRDARYHAPVLIGW